MKKLLFFVESLSGGGAEKVLTDLVSNLDKKKYDITVCSLVDIGVYNDYLNSICNYKSILPSGNDLNKLQNLIYRMKYRLSRILPASLLHKLYFKEKYDVEIAFIEGYATKIIGASHNKSSKKIAWVHIDLFANHWTKIEYKSLMQEINTYKKFNHIVSVAKSVQEAFSKKFGITKGLMVKYNPVDRDSIILKSIEPLNSSVKKGIRFVTVGRLESQKGYDRLLKVVNMLKKEAENFELWIVGEGSKRNELENFIKDNQLKEIVTLMGFQSNPYKFIQASDVFVCSSRSEGFSTVVTEALILGKPVIATNCSGMTELLGDSEYGMITENSTEALYVGLEKFLKDQSLRNHYTQKSIERSTDFDIRKTVVQIEELL